jgi:transposase-like protein
LSISTDTRSCPHCAEPMFLVNVERGRRDIPVYKCSSCKKTSEFVQLSEAPTLWLNPKSDHDIDG